MEPFSSHKEEYNFNFVDKTSKSYKNVRIKVSDQTLGIEIIPKGETPRVEYRICETIKMRGNKKKDKVEIDKCEEMPNQYMIYIPEENFDREVKDW